MRTNKNTHTTPINLFQPPQGDFRDGGVDDRLQGRVKWAEEIMSGAFYDAKASRSLNVKFMATL